MSDTPRSDACAMEVSGSLVSDQDGEPLVTLRFARILERENATLTAEVERKQADANRYQWLREQFCWDNFGKGPPEDPQPTIRWVVFLHMDEPLNWSEPPEKWNPKEKLDLAIDKVLRKTKNDHS